MILMFFVSGLLNKAKYHNDAPILSFGPSKCTWLTGNCDWDLPRLNPGANDGFKASPEVPNAMGSTEDRFRAF